MKNNNRIHKFKIIIILIIGVLICFISYNFFLEYNQNKKKVVLDLLKIKPKIEEIEYKIKFSEEDDNLSHDYGLVKIGYITDAHCFKMRNNITGKIEYVNRCKNPINNFLREMRTFKPDFFLEGGDLVDDHYEEVKNNFLFLSDWLKTGIFGQRVIRDSASSEVQVQNREGGNEEGGSLMPLFHVMGNHEANAFEKKEWLAITGYENPYYYFDFNGWRFVVLDSNNIKTINGEIDADSQNDAYQGYIKEKQYQWLAKLLRNSQKYNVAIFIHAPILYKTDTKKKSELFVGEEKVRSLIKKYGVKAVFSGHIEDLCYQQDGKTTYYALKGFWKKNKDLKNKYSDYLGYFYELNFSPQGEVRVRGFYQKNINLPFEKFDIDGEEFNCIGRF